MEVEQLMNMTLVKALAALVPAYMLFTGSVALFNRRHWRSVLLQILGTSGMLIVVLTHICDVFHWFPEMQWGAEHSVGHYLDLAGAIAAATLFPVGYFLYALSQTNK
jgi:hypothetical protein